MIRCETFFLDCHGVPPEMIARFDRPWNFIGEIEHDFPYLRAFCKKCNQRPVEVSRYDYDPKYDSIRIVDMKGHEFVTGDMLYVFVWFGVCDECDSIYWARRAPPYERARRPVFCK